MLPLWPALAVALFLTPAQAHDSGTGTGSWIGNRALHNPVTNEWCCGENDCRPYEKRLVHRVPGGFVVEYLDYSKPAPVPLVKEFVPDAEVMPSIDEQYWRCHKPDWTRRCFFAPMGPSM